MITFDIVDFGNVSTVFLFWKKNMKFFQEKSEMMMTTVVMKLFFSSYLNPVLPLINGF